MTGNRSFFSIYILYNLCILEVLSPQRPPAPPTEYLQVIIGGYDMYNLISISNHTKLTGYVGCIRGLKIGSNVIELIRCRNNSTNHSGKNALHCHYTCYVILFLVFSRLVLSFFFNYNFSKLKYFLI